MKPASLIGLLTALVILAATQLAPPVRAQSPDDVPWADVPDDLAEAIGHEATALGALDGLSYTGPCETGQPGQLCARVLTLDADTARVAIGLYQSEAEFRSFVRRDGAWAVDSTTSTPSPSPTATVPAFPSSSQYLRAFPGPVEDSWYVYASGFTPRVAWILVESGCPSLPCPTFGVATRDVVKEDGTMTFYVRLPRSPEAGERLLVALQEPLTGADLAADAPSVRVAGHNPGPERADGDPGGVLGYPAGTRTGITAVDEVVALSQDLDTAALRGRLVMKAGATTTGTPVSGLANWQCQPYTQAEGNLDQVFEYPAGLVYAVFRVPDSAALPLRYHGADYGIAWYDGGVDVPLGGLTLVDGDGRIVGMELRCGTTPGYHVHDFTDFVLAPFDSPTLATPTIGPGPPQTGSGTARGEGGAVEWRVVLAAIALLLGVPVASAIVARIRKAWDSGQAG